MLTQYSFDSARYLASVRRGLLLPSIALATTIFAIPGYANTIDNIGVININSSGATNPETIYNGDTLNNKSGGTINVNSGGTLEIKSGGVVNNESGGTVNVNNDGNILNNALLTLTNAGSFNVNGTGTVTGSGSLVQSAGTLTVNGSLTQSALDINGGTLQGIGTITAPVTITNGTVAHGTCAAGTLTVAHNLTLTSGSINIQIGGTNSGEYDLINLSSGAASFAASTIHFSFINNYSPMVGEYVDFVTTTAGITGVGGLNFDYSALLGGYHYSVDTTNTDHTLRFNISSQDVPEPGSFGLFGLGLAALMWQRRKPQFC